MNIAEHIERAAAFCPARAAILFEGKTITYQELNTMAGAFARALQQIGVTAGDRVGLYLPNIPEFIIAYCAILKIGAIALSINCLLKHNELKHIVADSTPKVIVVNADLLNNLPPDCPAVRIVAEGEAGAYLSFARLLEAYPPVASALDMKGDAPAAIVYSSGTTGVPKGATLSHNNVITNMQAKKKYCGIREDDRGLLFVPLFHCFGQNAVMNSLLNAGATIVLHRQFDYTRVMESLKQDQVTMFFSVPTIFILLLNKAQPDDFRHVRYFFSAAAQLPAEIARRWQERFGLAIFTGYGLSETSPFASYNHLEKYKFGSIGTPIDGVAMKIVSLEDGRDLGPGEAGEILIKGENVMLGYWNQPQATRDMITEGWLHSGDIGKTDADGYFYIVDRLRDMINVGGLKVYPAEVENVIYQHPAVLEAAVYAGPDPVTGERVEARIILKPGCKCTSAEIVNFCREQLANYKVPVSVVFTESLPKNRTGKILKRILREEANARAAQN